MPRKPLLAALFPALLSGLFAAPPAAAEDQGAASALVKEAIRHEHAEGKVRDYAQAHRLYCEAARMKSADALLRMGWMYANGRGVQRDDGVAHLLFAHAAKLGNEVAGRLATTISAPRGAKPGLPACLQPRPRPELFVEGSDEQARFVAGPGSAAHRALVQSVVAQAGEYRIDPRLVFAVMRAESNFNPRARSPKNAQGLMQLMPGTAERFAVADVYDPVQNVRGGIRYLRWLLSYYRGDVVLALAAYNAGEGAVDRYGGVPPYGETLAYVARIRAMYPRDRHPYDAKIVAASPVIAKRALQLADASPARLQSASITPGE
jgi:soluble lytic murein transglycosylase-like protein